MSGSIGVRVQMVDHQFLKVKASDGSEQIDHRDYVRLEESLHHGVKPERLELLADRPEEGLYYHAKGYVMVAAVANDGAQLLLVQSPRFLVGEALSQPIVIAVNRRYARKV